MTDARLTRRRLLAATAGLAGVTGTARTAARTSPLPEGPTVRLDPVAEGFAAPVGFEEAPGVEDRWFVADQAGQVYAVGPDGRPDGPFLDVADRMVSLSGYEERGLLGLAFHPGFDENGRLFVRYSAPPRSGTPSGYDHTFVLSEFRATDDRTGVVPDSERTVLEIPEPQSNHNGGAVAFGPDGYLYVGVGDGGGGGDTGRGHAEDWYDGNAGGNGQDVAQNLLGSVLRIDVDAGDDRPYAVPEDNPLVGREGRDEHWAWGFRNPWRLSFDDDRLFVADVGQNRYEEVDLVERGGNYGWNVREGAHCYDADSCPTRTRDGRPLRDPIVEYPHVVDGTRIGTAVIGGFVYRGDALPDLRNTYVFGDWSTAFSSPRGSLFAARPPTDDGQWSMSKLRVASGDFDRFVLAFGRDRDGELYVCTSRRGGVRGSTGAVHRLVPPDGTTTSASDGGSGGSGGDPGTTATTTTTGGQSGVGLLAALAGFGGAAALSRRWRRR